MQLKLDTDRMLAEKEGAIGWMTFNHPARHNALSMEMLEAVPVIVEAFDTDPDVHVVVLKGAGEKSFISGADVSEIENEDVETIEAGFDRLAEEAYRSLTRCSKPTIAMIHGFCLGGGVGTALYCDLRIASDGSRFAIPSGRLGSGYRLSGLRQLMDLVGPAKTMEIFFTARQFSAEEAYSMGLVNQVVAPDELEAEVTETCRRIAENAPLTLRAIKTQVTQLRRPADELDEELCERVMRACFESEDYAEGRRAFLEKRKPVFSGR